MVIREAFGNLNTLKTIVGPSHLGEILIELGYISQTQLDGALDYQKQNGGNLGWILATLGYINRLELYEGLAMHFKLPFVKDNSYILKNIDKKLTVMLTHEEIVKYQVIPYFVVQDNTLYILTANPGDKSGLELIRQRFGTEYIKQIIITDLDLMKISEELNRVSIIDKSINGLLYRNPDESAYKVITRPQWIFLACLLSGLVTWAFFKADTLIVAMIFVVQFFFIAPVFFKLFVCVYYQMKKNSKPAHIDANVPWAVGNWPVYTVLIAAYKEKNVIGTLIKSLKKLDYPENKLDIILLLEKDDVETLEAAKKEKPSANWRFLVLPDSTPRTKPKALNYGLHFARGEYLTIYDAEDLPEPDQLKKAVTAFRTHPDNYICFQAALNYFNRDENFLTRMFTLEYSSWFDCLLPGLFKSNLPIPLGGTSNHFDVQKLKRIGAWDPFNVTEDADLGIRASVEGYKVGVIDSTTYEEANSQLKNWINQRSRWVKGYMQTFLVYSRHPLKVIKAMGFTRWLSYAWLVGGTPVNFLLFPIMWALFGLSFFFNFYGYLHVPDWLMYLSLFNLVIGNVAVIFIALLGVFMRKNYSLIPYALLSPVYWLLQSAGAFRGLWQLLVRPFYWEKTQHGLTKCKADLPDISTLAK
ncbi:MAG: glycosyltransferase [Dehalococcoidales bacterium]|nr:glycosyltransferase [Dehalococcoidales bacterium]